MHFAVLLLALLGLAMPGVAMAAPEDDLRALRDNAIAIPGATVSEYPSLTIVQDQFTLYYFTKPGHYAHPAAVQRIIFRQADGSWAVDYRTWPYAGPETASPAFQQWMAEFFELDRQMFEAIKREQAP